MKHLTANNPQEVVNALYKHFVTDENPFGYDQEIHECQFRTFDGNACAFGVFIPDDKYQKGLEGLTISEMLVNRLFIDIFEPMGLSIEDWTVIQSIHDETAILCTNQVIRRQKFTERLNVFCADKRLKVPV